MVGSSGLRLAFRRAVSVLILRPLPPFRLDLTVWALRRRPRNAIDRWDGSTYRRVILVGRRPTEFEVRQTGPVTAPRLVVTTTPSLRTPAEREFVRSTLNDLLGLRIDLRDWYRTAGRDPRLHALAQRFRGMKPPKFPSLFEALVTAFACQQLSLVVCLELLNRLARLCDVRVGKGANAHYAFPPPRRVARIAPPDGQALGFSGQKIRALLTLASGIESGQVDFGGMADQSDEQVSARLCELRGVGRWTADYVMLRGLRRLNIFPGDDVGAQKSLARWLGRPSPLDYAGVTKAVAKWQPYAGMVYFHLLLDGLARAGELIE